MAGSQLKRLKETLKAEGLTGQTYKKSGKNKKGPTDTRRDAKERIIKKIREEFNPFEVKATKNKYDIQELRKKKVTVAKPGVSKQIGEEERRRAYELKKSRKNKVGGVLDRRFGANDSTLTEEEKMLERFTRERQQLVASKKSLFDLEDDDEDEFEEGEDGGFNILGGDSTLGSGKRFHNEGESEEEAEVESPPKKKTKAEVMKEIIAKSKLYKHERQKKQAELENQVADLNEGFDDVMSDLRAVSKEIIKQSRGKIPTVDEEKKKKDMEYTQTLKKLTLERRAVPADRTKTQEEIDKEVEENKKRLEAARQARMEGLDREEGVGDDLDFWEKSDDEENENKDSEEEEEEEDDDEADEADEELHKKSHKNKTLSGLIKCPETHSELLDISSDISRSVEITRTILSKYKPSLAQGNNERLAKFSGVLFEHILFISESLSENEEYASILEELIKILKKMMGKYTSAVTDYCREHIREIEENFLFFLGGQDVQFPRVSDMTFFTIVGMLYSTSDHYHLVVTPATLVLCQSINLVKDYTDKHTFYGLFVCELLGRYQRIAKRYIPETVEFLSRTIASLNDAEFEVTDSDFDKAKAMRVSDLNGDSFSKGVFIIKAIDLVDAGVAVWKEKAAFPEISLVFMPHLASLEKKFSGHEKMRTKVASLIEKIQKVSKFADHAPLTLQSHKPIAIATHAPKYEENFNPEKKSYDTDASRQEISKLKAQIKKERKITIKELRKDNQFVARQSIKETKEKYEQYHRKMALLINSINTVEGSERNEYDREKRRRKNKK